MFSIFDRLRRQHSPPPGEAVDEPIASVVIATQPLVVGDPPDKVAYARYRIGAIERHLEHNTDVSPLRRGEFRQEILGLLGDPQVAPFISAEEEHDALVLAGVRAA